MTVRYLLVNDLLALARSDGGVLIARNEPVNLNDIVLHEARRLRDRARVAIDTSRVSVGPINGDPDALTRAVRNLCENAERHAARN